MKYEFHAQYPFALQDSVTQAGAMEWLVGKRSSPPHAWPELATIQDDYQRIQLLAQAIVTAYKEQARAGAKRNSGGFQYWLDREAGAFLKRQHQWLGALQLTPALPDLTIFPRNAFALYFTFTLHKPYLSKDDTDLYIIDNPVKKEWVFKTPYVASSQWKGALRADMMQDLVGTDQGEEAFWDKRLQLYRLFGNEKDGAAKFLNRAWALRQVGPRPEGEKEGQQWGQKFQETVKQVTQEFEQRLREHGYRAGDIEGVQGRLRFYPTFFDRIGLEVINPHDRQTGAGARGPILFESVPAGAKGRFTLLYVPFDRIGKDEDETKKQALEDLQLVAEGLHAMFTLYGFGAKTSSGFGVAEDTVEQGLLALNLPDIVFPQAETPQAQKPDDAYLKYLDEAGKVRSVFEGSGEGGMMSNREYKNEGQQLGGGSLSEFKVFRQWYSRYGEQWQETLKVKSRDANFTSFPFERFRQINEVLSQIGVGDD